jgi:hypothetical protein
MRMNVIMEQNGNLTAASLMCNDPIGGDIIEVVNVTVGEFEYILNAPASKKNEILKFLLNKNKVNNDVEPENNDSLSEIGRIIIEALDKNL